MLNTSAAQIADAKAAIQADLEILERAYFAGFKNGDPGGPYSDIARLKDELAKIEAREQLQDDIISLEAASACIDRICESRYPKGHWREIGELAVVKDLKEQLAELDAADVAAVWAKCQKAVEYFETNRFSMEGNETQSVTKYVRHLEAELAKRSDANLTTRIVTLKVETS